MATRSEGTRTPVVGTPVIGVPVGGVPVGGAPVVGAPVVGATAGADADAVADQFEVLASANRWFDDELHLIYRSPTPLSQSTVNRLVVLGERMRPAAEVRDRLARLEPAVLLAGVRVWVGRQAPVADGSAAGRAERVWSAGALPDGPVGGIGNQAADE
jgi:hypothetical protein